MAFEDFIEHHFKLFPTNPSCHSNSTSLPTTLCTCSARWCTSRTFCKILPRDILQVIPSKFKFLNNFNLDAYMTFSNGRKRRIPLHNRTVPLCMCVVGDFNKETKTKLSRGLVSDYIYKTQNFVRYREQTGNISI